MAQEVELLLKAKNLSDEAFKAVEAHMKSLENHQKKTQSSFAKGRKSINDWATKNQASFRFGKCSFRSLQLVYRNQPIYTCNALYKPSTSSKRPGNKVMAPVTYKTKTSLLVGEPSHENPGSPVTARINMASTEDQTKYIMNQASIVICHEGNTGR